MYNHHFSEKMIIRWVNVLTIINIILGFSENNRQNKSFY
jgi:hypothetical protein